MSTRSEKRRARAAAAKERRQKIIAFGGLGVLAILLVIQGPKLLDAVGGSSDGSTAAPPVAPIGSVPQGKAGPRRTLKFASVGSDPFGARYLANNDPKAEAVSGPDGAKDPFARGRSGGESSSSATSPVREPALQPLPKRIVIGTPRPGVVAKRGWIVVLASIQTRVGRDYANRFAARVRRDGLGSISVLNSSTRKPLRAGYYVVYTGPFATLSEVQRSAAHVHAFGYRTAYVREILRY